MNLHWFVVATDVIIAVLYIVHIVSEFFVKMMSLMFIILGFFLTILLLKASGKYSLDMIDTGLVMLILGVILFII